MFIPAHLRSWPTLSHQAVESDLGLPGRHEAAVYTMGPTRHAASLYPEHDLFVQLTKLKNTLRHIMGETLITHLGLDYYDQE